MVTSNVNHKAETLGALANRKSQYIFLVSTTPQTHNGIAKHVSIKIFAASNHIIHIRSYKSLLKPLCEIKHKAEDTDSNQRQCQSTPAAASPKTRSLPVSSSSVGAAEILR